MTGCCNSHHVSERVESKSVGVDAHVELPVVLGNVVDMSLPDQTSAEMDG